MNVTLCWKEEERGGRKVFLIFNLEGKIVRKKVSIQFELTKNDSLLFNQAQLLIFNRGIGDGFDTLKRTFLC